MTPDTAAGRELEDELNELHVIAPYKYHGMWVFDDARVGLAQEPFVGGANTIIDVMTQNISNAANGFTMVFAADAFPGYQFQFEWRSPQGSGNLYYSSDLQLEGWLCPALLRYFESPPPRLFVQVELPKRRQKQPALAAASGEPKTLLPAATDFECASRADQNR